MNVNENDFQKRLDELGDLYEGCKDAIYGTDSKYGYDQSAKALLCLQKIRDIAAIAIKQAYQLKEN